MGQITLNFDDSMHILNNPDAAPDATVVAAAFIVFFNAQENGDAVTAETRSIAQKLLRMAATALDDGGQS